jgi:hypothetical protein
LGRDIDTKARALYAKAADDLAAHELSTMAANAPRVDLVEGAVVGTVGLRGRPGGAAQARPEHHPATRSAQHVEGSLRLS